MKRIDVEPAANNDEIVVYQPEGAEFHIAVRVENETVWLTQAQMAELFGVKENTITYHIQEIFNTDELEQIPTTRKIRVVRQEGKRNVARQNHPIMDEFKKEAASDGA